MDGFQLSNVIYFTKATERRFRKACDQIVRLNQRLGDVQKRYMQAKRCNNRAFQGHHGPLFHREILRNLLL